MFKAAAGGSTKATGDSAESLALARLQARGLVLVNRNVRVTRGLGARGGEIDLVPRDQDGTLVFVEGRARRSVRQGGAAASVGASKQRAIAFAAQHYLLRLDLLPPCRFDVVAIDAGQVEWIRGAFNA